METDYDLERQLLAEEGFRAYAYQDTEGYWTVGVGRLIDRRKGGGISEDEALFLLRNDILRCRRQVYVRLPWIRDLNAPREAVLVGMAFQMGLDGLLTFKRTLAWVENGDFASAAGGMLASKWAMQTPSRAYRMAKQMRTGEWQLKQGFEPKETP